MFKKVGIYLALVFIGLFVGYLVFGTSNATNEIHEVEIVANSGKWTCSMHPQVDGKENGTCPLCAMDLVLMDSSAEILVANQFEMSKEAIALANIQTFEVGQSSSSVSTLRLSGILTTNKETDAVQTTLFDGRLEKLHTNFVGKKVRKGQEIGLIYSPELYAAQDKLLTSISYRDTHEKLYNSARNTLGLWKITDEQIEKMLENGKPMMNFPLLADVSGTITEVLASEGNYYKQGAPLYKTSDLRMVWAEFDAYQEQIEFLKVGQDVEVQINGLPNENIKAKITFIEPIIDELKRTFLVRVNIKNMDGNLKPGMVVEGKVNAKISNEESIVIPKSAILWTGEKSLVYKKPHHDSVIFELTQVVLGQSLEDEYEILEGLRVGDLIVSQGVFTIDAAAQLKGKKSMMHSGGISDEKINDDRLDDKDIRSKVKISLITENSFTKSLDPYIALKDAFITSDKQQIKKASQQFLSALSDEVKVNGEKTSFIQELETSLNRIVKLSEIEKQRREFKVLSSLMIDVTSSKDNVKSTLYVQHCDCADGFKGASWLSYRENIENPYFGDAMLTCGRVEQVLN